MWRRALVAPLNWVSFFVGFGGLCHGFVSPLGLKNHPLW